jgi:hypothetical protein
MELIPIIRNLEAQTVRQRMSIIQAYLDEWAIPHRLHRYPSGNNLWIPAKRHPFIGIGSHYDMVRGSPGANDNASAVAVTLELLRRQVAFPLGIGDLQFFFFDEEERGLLGSKAFIKDEGMRGMLGLINLELVGRGDRLALWPLKPNSQGFLIKAIEEQAQKLGVIVHRFDHLIMHSADHESFRDAGMGENAFTLTCISKQDVEIAADYFKALALDASHATLWEIMRKAPIFEHYHQSTDSSVHLSEDALQMVSDVIWGSLQNLSTWK